MRYTKSEDRTLIAGDRKVIDWVNGVAFKCLCGERVVTINRNVHRVTVDEQGHVTLDPSCGYHADPGLDRKQNWCHFWLKDGVIEMCGDAECPDKGMVHES